MGGGRGGYFLVNFNVLTKVHEVQYSSLIFSHYKQRLISLNPFNMFTEMCLHLLRVPLYRGAPSVQSEAFRQRRACTGSEGFPAVRQLRMRLSMSQILHGNQIAIARPKCLRFHSIGSFFFFFLQLYLRETWTLWVLLGLGKHSSAPAKWCAHARGRGAEPVSRAGAGPLQGLVSA